MPESNFPASLDTDANSSLPKTISNTAALNNPNHAEMHGRGNDAIIEMQTKIGTGSSGTPTGTTQAAATGAVLIGTGSGASAWDTTPTFVGDVTIPEGDLILGSTAVTSTAAELNILDGCTATVSELNIMDGVTATTSELNILDGVTATAAEINVLDGVTGGTVTASKVIVVDANKDAASFRNVTLTGDLTAANAVFSGDITCQDAITFEGSTANDYETTIAVTDPTADRTFTIADQNYTLLRNIYVQADEPSGGTYFTGDLWIDT